MLFFDTIQRIFKDKQKAVPSIQGQSDAKKVSKIRIAYGTTSGNSKLVANEAQRYLASMGVNAKSQNMSKLKAKHLMETDYLLAIISTDGEGVPPQGAKAFLKSLSSKSSEPLHHLQFSVCALGDSSYDHFCQAGKMLEKKLSKLDAKPFYPRTNCDTEFAQTAIAWVKATSKIMLEKNDNPNKAFNANLAIKDKVIYNSRVQEIYKLSKGDVEKPCYHISLKTEHNITEIKPGDSIEIKPHNPSWLVKDIATYLNVTNDNEAVKQLKSELEITTISKSLLSKYYKLCPNPQLEKLLGNETELKNYVRKANVYDVLIDFFSDAKSRQILKILPKLQRRFYSVASCTETSTKQLDLTIKTIRYKYQSRKHEGAGSVLLTEQIKVNDGIKFKHYPNLNFRLPKDISTPIIMIGVGTGIAPFRAFLQYRVSKDITNKSWLIWGDKHQNQDFLYEKEIKFFQEQKVLSRVDFTFSRSAKEKQYVQHLLTKNGKEVLKWLDKGAHIYVCGSLAMAKDVRKALENLMGNKALPDCLSFKSFMEQERYHEDAY